jgi:ASC-1-like (ASCH) protein
MKHEMKLDSKYFDKIKDGTKTIELRLYDEKRSKIKENDIIEFTNRDTNKKLCVQVLKLYRFKNFKELYECFNKTSIGYNEDEIANPEDMNQFYSKEEQDKYGVVAIEIKNNTR